MNPYSLLKRLTRVKSPRLRLLMVACARMLRARHIGVFVDPVIACNIRCQMCYFSSDSSRPAPQPPMTQETVRAIERILLPHALKLQIGCGAEPTLKPDAVASLIEAGKRAGVPYIEITTNGQLLNRPLLEEFIVKGLDGMTLSLHGTSREIYQRLMKGASFDKLVSLIDTIRQIQTAHPGFKLRINYTVNNLNKTDLPGLWELFGGVKIDVLQVRPIQRLGDTPYNDFIIADQRDFIEGIIEPLADECRRRGVTSFVPTLKNLMEVHKPTKAADSQIEALTYCYVGPSSEVAKPEFKVKNTLRALFLPSKRAASISTKKLNYN